MTNNLSSNIKPHQTMTTQTTAPRSAPSAAAPRSSTEYGLGHDLESDLPVIPALAEIDHIRVIDKSGASYRATPAQMREMVGIDHSILTEQLIPGEFAVGRDGTRKQVYTQTFTGTIARSEPAQNRLGLSRDFVHVPIQVTGFCQQGVWDDPTVVPNPKFSIICWGNWGISIEFDPSLLGKHFAIAVKYTK